MKPWQFFGVCGAIYVAPHIPAIAGVVIGAACLVLMVPAARRGDE